MRRLSKLSARFIGERGFSIGVDDVIPVSRLSDEVANVTSSSYEACQVCVAPYSHMIVTVSILPFPSARSGVTASDVVVWWYVAWCKAGCGHHDQSTSYFLTFTNCYCAESVKAILQVQELIASYKLGKLQLMPGCDEEQSLEHEILGVLNQIRTTASEVKPACLFHCHTQPRPARLHLL